MRIIFVIMATVLLSVRTLPAQDSLLMVGSPVPNVVFNDLQYYKHKSVSLKDFKGKWLILDFWSRWCPACVKNLPALNALQNKHRDKVQVLLIGRKDELTPALYENFKRRYDLKLPITYDNALHSRFGIQAYPFVVCVDDKGIVRDISSHADNESFEKILNEKKDFQKQALKKRKADFDWQKPFRFQNNGGSDTSYLYRSMLTAWTTDLPIAYPESLPARGSREVLAMGISLKALYRIAYGDTVLPIPLMNTVNNYGSWWREPLIETSDTSMFIYDYHTGHNIFCYSLTVPKTIKSRVRVQKIIQGDLRNYFNFAVEVTMRPMPYWKIVATPSKTKELTTKNGPAQIQGDGLSTLVLQNQPISTLVSIMWGLHQEEPPFIDETRLTTNIDITLNTILTEFDSLKAELKKNGLELVKSTKMTKVIIIKDNVEKL